MNFLSLQTYSEVHFIRMIWHYVKQNRGSGLRYWNSVLPDKFLVTSRISFNISVHLSSISKFSRSQSKAERFSLKFQLTGKPLTIVSNELDFIQTIGIM